MAEVKIVAPVSKKKRRGRKKLKIKTLGKRYKLTKLLGSGAFGEIYHAYHLKTQEEYAIKLEPRKNRHSQLLSEAKLYQYFSKVHPSGITNSLH